MPNGIDQYRHLNEGDPMKVSLEEMEQLMAVLARALNRNEITAAVYKKGTTAIDIGFEHLNLSEEEEGDHDARST